MEDLSEMSIATKLEALRQMTDGDVEVHIDKLEVCNGSHSARPLTRDERDLMQKLFNHLREYANDKKRYH